MGDYVRERLERGWEVTEWLFVPRLFLILFPKIQYVSTKFAHKGGSPLSWAAQGHRVALFHNGPLVHSFPRRLGREPCCRHHPP